MFEIVDAYQGTRHPKRDWPMAVALAVVVLVMLALAVSVARFARLSYRHNVFMQDLSASMMYARSNDSLEAAYRGVPMAVTAEQASRIAEKISDAGMGKPSARQPDDHDGVFLAFGDGSTLQLCPVAIDGGEVGTGVLVRYQDAQGRVYSYDTDKLQMSNLTLGW